MSKLVSTKSICHWSLVLAIVLFMECEVNGQAASNSSAVQIPSFKQEIWPTFVVKCNNNDCHGAKGSAFPKFQAYLMVKSKSKKILKKLEDENDPMPPKDAPIPITDIEIERIRKWIEAGAPDNLP